MFFPFGNSLRLGAGLKGQGRVTLGLCGYFQVGEAELGGWQFPTALCEMSKGKGSATSQAFHGAPGLLSCWGKGGGSKCSAFLSAAWWGREQLP